MNNYIPNNHQQKNLQSVKDHPLLDMSLDNTSLSDLRSIFADKDNNTLWCQGKVRAREDKQHSHHKSKRLQMKSATKKRTKDKLAPPHTLPLILHCSHKGNIWERESTDHKGFLLDL
jgi:hypothetical protein